MRFDRPVKAYFVSDLLLSALILIGICTHFQGMPVHPRDPAKLSLASIRWLLCIWYSPEMSFPPLFPQLTSLILAFSYSF